MTNFAVQSTLGAVAPLVSKDKGSAGNRIDCAGSQIKNNATTALQTVAVGGAAVGATRVVVRDTLAFSPITKGLTKTFDSAMKLIGKIAKKPDLSQKVTEYLNSMAKKIQKANIPHSQNTIVKVFDKSKMMTSRFKAAAVIAAVLLPTLGYIAHKHSYKAGQIDQKYTDKAQIQKAV